MIRPLLALAAALAAPAPAPAPAAAQKAPAPSYFDHPNEARPLAGGARMITISTPRGRFRVWTKRVGNNPKVKVLLLHGGPAAGHAYFEAFDSFLPQEGIEYIYYDQLGAGDSDRPDGDELWTIPRFVDEVEQVRTALGLDRSNFCLLGHSWGGILAIEYALKHQANLKCLVISNMQASIPAYNAYARRVLMPAMDQRRLAEVQAMERDGRTEGPAYMALLTPLHYEKHVLRLPAADWPEPVNRAFARLNRHVYVLMQGPSELGASGRLAEWDRTADLSRITVPTLTIGARHDTMDPAAMRSMAAAIPKGEAVTCEAGSHMAMWDDQPCYFGGLTAFLKKIERLTPP
jgi:proline iminopeptidase